jgi:hypothetical protein
LYCPTPLWYSSVTVSETERAFSKLQNQLNTWKKLRPGSNAFILFEHETASNIDFSDVISDFSLKKARKAKLD